MLTPLSDDFVHVTEGGCEALDNSAFQLPQDVQEVLVQQLRITSLFDVQAVLLQHIRNYADRDIVLCAPTGSGKTLAYALPILSSLSLRLVCKLRAVIVVPTRELASQVHSVFESLTSRSSMRIGIATGSRPLENEANSLRDIDVLVATPGRLAEHTRDTTNFSLSAVKFLVLDESDRLLHDSFHEWVPLVVPECGRANKLLAGRYASDMSDLALHFDLSSPPRVRPLIILTSATQTRDPKRLVLLDMHRPILYTTLNAPNASPHIQTDPETKNLFALPASLAEQTFVLGGMHEKPAALAKLLGIWKGSATGSISELTGAGRSKLVFTNSVESAHRLARLLELLVWHSDANLAVFEMSGALSAERRSSVLQFAANISSPGGIHQVASPSAKVVIVCSDYMARGMDIEGVDAVINYDAPVHLNTYLHRVGRTARAGRIGIAVSLVLQKQARHFKAIVRAAERGESKMRFVNTVSMEEGFDNADSLVARTLESLRRVLRREDLGLLKKEDPLPWHTLRDLERLSASADSEKLRIKRKRTSTIDHRRALENVCNAWDVKEEVVGDTLSDILRAQVAKRLSTK